MAMQRNAYDVLRERDFVQQVTDDRAVHRHFAENTVTVYTGYDPTADSLHVGHLFTLMALKHLEMNGHRPIVVLGGGTAMVGDPSGKTELRQMLSRETIQENVRKIAGQIDGLLDVAGGKTRVVDNAEWLLELNYIDFLRDIGRHFSVNRMLAAESYKIRLEKGLSFIEFNYQLLQAYDFLQLSQRYDCTMQMGGDDQWGNILAGIDLIRRVDQKLVHGATFPLLLTATGEKMGKTAAGAVWLSAERLAPYDYFQYWVNCHDDDVVRLLKFFTLLPVAEIEKVRALQDADINQAKFILAYEATALIHGKDEATRALRAARGGFGSRAISDALLPSSAIPRAIEADLSELPTTRLDAANLSTGIPLMDLLVRAGFAKSKSAARRLIEQGGVRIHQTRITDAFHQVRDGDMVDGEIILRSGKKNIHRLVVEA